MVKSLLAKGHTDVLVVGAVTHVGHNLVRIVNHKSTPGPLGREMLEQIPEVLRLGITYTLPQIS